MKVNEQPGDHIDSSYVLGQATAGTVDSWPVFRAPGKVKVTGVRWIPSAAVAGAVTNNFALTARNKGTDNTKNVAVTTAKTYDNGVNSVANAPESLTLSATAADLEMAAGEVLILDRTVNGTGLAMPDGQVEVSYQYR